MISKEKMIFFTLLNCLFYADDLVLISASAAGLEPN